MNGLGTASDSPSIVDLALLHHLEQRRLRLAGARLISSASSKFVNTGPLRSRIVPLAAS